MEQTMLIILIAFTIAQAQWWTYGVFRFWLNRAYSRKGL